MSLSQEAERRLEAVLGNSAGNEIIAAMNNGVNPSGPFSAGCSVTLFGLFGVTPVARTAAYTQTYATASRTHAAFTAAALTDSTGGSATGTLAAATNVHTLTDSSGGTASTTAIAALAGVTGSGSNAAPLVATQNNFATLAAELATQRSLNTVLVNAVASLAAQVNALIVDLANAKQVLNSALTDLKAYGLFQ